MVDYSERKYPKQAIIFFSFFSGQQGNRIKIFYAINPEKS